MTPAEQAVEILKALETSDALRDHHCGREMATIVTLAHSLVSALEAHEQAVEGWRPIESAPKDGTYVLISDGECVDEARAIDGSWWATNSDPSDVWGVPLYPTHWMPLPHAPASPVDGNNQ